MVTLLCLKGIMFQQGVVSKGFVDAADDTSTSDELEADSYSAYKRRKEDAILFEVTDTCSPESEQVVCVNGGPRCSLPRLAWNRVPHLSDAEGGCWEAFSTPTQAGRHSSHACGF